MPNKSLKSSTLRQIYKIVFMATLCFFQVLSIYLQNSFHTHTQKFISYRISNQLQIVRGITTFNSRLEILEFLKSDIFVYGNMYVDNIILTSINLFQTVHKIVSHVYVYMHSYVYFKLYQFLLYWLPPAKYLEWIILCWHISGQFTLLWCSEEIKLGLPRLIHYFSLANVFYVMDLYFILLVFLQRKSNLKRL